MTKRLRTTKLLLDAPFMRPCPGCLNPPPAESRVPSFSSLPPVPQLPTEIQPLWFRYRGLSQQQNGATSLPFQRLRTSSVHGPAYPAVSALPELCSPLRRSPCTCAHAATSPHLSTFPTYLYSWAAAIHRLTALPTLRKTSCRAIIHTCVCGGRGGWQIRVS